jgi:hypothetical protein
VNIENNSWQLTHINKYDTVEKAKISKKLNNIKNDNLNTNNTTINETGSSTDNKTTRLIKRRSSSTSYLNEEDDYGDDYPYYNNEDLKKFRKQLSLEDKLDEESKQHESKHHKHDKKKHLKEQKSFDSEMDEANSTIEDNLNSTSFSYRNNNENTSASSSSSREHSDRSDSEDNDDLYAIDEYDETIQTVDCDQGKKYKFFYFLANKVFFVYMLNHLTLNIFDSLHEILHLKCKYWIYFT